MKQTYLDDGYLYLNKFLTTDQLEITHSSLSQAIIDSKSQLSKKWQDEKISFFTRENGQAEDFISKDYFLSSYNKIHLFYEEIENELQINRVGHGLHLDQRYPILGEIIYNNEYLHRILKELGYIRPICYLSVYIPKYPKKVGGKVVPHQENTFAFTEPLSCIVLWIALENATIENACMWGLKKSHLAPLKRVSKVNHLKRTRQYVELNNYIYPDFENSQKMYTPLETNRGDALLFHGNYVHCSEVNQSDHSRKAISFQIIESYKTKLMDFNWILRPSNRPLYDLSSNSN